MPSILFLLFRRMRLPLIVLISTYAVSIVGLVLIPGQDANGGPRHMDLFHAFYFVSFMGSTIGFGEIPYPFTDAQRMWTTFTIYATVVSWLYGIGAMLGVLQDPAFRRVVKQRSFERAVRRLKEPFYLVCGYGDTGSMLVRALTARGISVVVIDIASTRIDDLNLEDLGFDVPGLVADAADPNALKAAGLNHRRCVGMIALTNDDQANLTIALSGKLLARDVPVICRADYLETEANMASFATDHTVNSFETFGSLLAEAVSSPHHYALYEWLTSPKLATIPEPLYPPRGTWIVCGYGRFGKAIAHYLGLEGIRVVVIEADPHKTGAPSDVVVGKGTEAVTLREAGIEQADAIVAGTDNGADNLSILLTARAIKPELFTVARQALRRYTPLFEAARPNVIIQPARVTARKVLTLIINPLLKDFLSLARERDDTWAEALIAKINHMAGGERVDTWTVRVTNDSTPALVEKIQVAQTVLLEHLMRDPRDRSRHLPAVPLLLKRPQAILLLPEADIGLECGDRILFGGVYSAESDMDWIGSNHNVLEYVFSGCERPAGWVWGLLGKDGDGT